MEEMNREEKGGGWEGQNFHLLFMLPLANESRLSRSEICLYEVMTLMVHLSWSVHTVLA